MATSVTETSVPVDETPYIRPLVAALPDYRPPFPVYGMIRSRELPVFKIGERSTRAGERSAHTIISQLG